MDANGMSLGNLLRKSMKYLICVFMLIVLASVHGLFEAAGSLSMNKDMHVASSLPVSMQKASTECCEGEPKEFSSVAYHCPLDGKILATGIEISPRTGSQVHVPAEVNQLGTMSFSAFFRPPIS